MPSFYPKGWFSLTPVFRNHDLAPKLEGAQVVEALETTTFFLVGGFKYISYLSPRILGRLMTFLTCAYFSNGLGEKPPTTWKTAVATFISINFYPPKTSNPVALKNGTLGFPSVVLLPARKNIGQTTNNFGPSLRLATGSNELCALGYDWILSVGS